MQFSGRKCRGCNLTIFTERGEQLTVYDGHSFHRGCFDKWVRKNLERLEGKQRKSGLNEMELGDLKEFRELAGLDANARNRN